MIFVLGLVACSSTEDPLRMIPRTKCWISYAIEEKEKDGVVETEEFEYHWSEDHSYVELESENEYGYGIYNEQGLPLESYWENENRSHETSREYECEEGYCWITKFWSRTITQDGLRTNSETYRWDGATRYFTDNDGWKGHTIFNEYGEPEDEYQLNRWTRKEIRRKKTYSCDDWCKLLKKETLKTVLFDSEQSTTQFNWTGNRRTSDANNNYKIYNEHGYVVELYKEKPEKTIWRQVRRDCEE